MKNQKRKVYSNGCLVELNIFDNLSIVPRGINTALVGYAVLAYTEISYTCKAHLCTYV
jgi:hypothetical protein